MRGVLRVLCFADGLTLSTDALSQSAGIRNAWVGSARAGVWPASKPWQCTFWKACFGFPARLRFYGVMR
jgi:hypothetical protein